jgi:sigma-B regulation protein RsbU (phosphoserine phosphatase)
MKKLPLLILLIPLCLGLRLIAQDQPTAVSGDDNIIDRAHAQNWINDISGHWLAQEGDNATWAAPGLDDSQWKPVEIDDLGIASPGWRWFRIHIKLHVNHPDLALLVQGGVGTYELYVNGAPLPGARILPSFAVNRPVEHVFPIDSEGTDLVLALRTHVPSGYTAWHFPQFMSVSLGTPDAIDTQRESLLHDRTFTAIPAIVINSLILVAGLALLALYSSQRGRLEYFWLGFYFLVVGIADILWYFQQSGFIPLACNVLLADPLLYAIIVAQTRFTFAFGGRRLGPIWNAYQFLLLIPIAIGWFVWFGKIPSPTYMIIEPLFILPVAILLPILLFVWYRRGNREAGWLILPSLLPPTTMALYDLGSAAIYFEWHRFGFLVNNISIGPVSLEPNDLSNLLFFLCTLIIIFLRFSRVSSEQARSAAKLAAAREIQQHLIPSSLPTLPGLRIEAAYVPVEEVAGDFYQVIQQANGSALIVVGDVSGKGLKAAMTATLAIGALRAIADENITPAQLLARLNHQICRANQGGFVTCLCAQIDRAGVVTLANAGHLSPYSAGAEIQVPPGLPLGLIDHAEYSELRYELPSGCTLTFLSDGVVEASDASGQLYGFERTRAISTQSANYIAAAAQAFGQEDDITVLTLTRELAGA